MNEKLIQAMLAGLGIDASVIQEKIVAMANYCQSIDMKLAAIETRLQRIETKIDSIEVTEEPDNPQAMLSLPPGVYTAAQNGR